jgi:5-methylcytosine-specific restriction endonuclease McrA
VKRDVVKFRCCSVKDCDRLVGSHGALGMCPAHYKRAKAGADLHSPWVVHTPKMSAYCSVLDCEHSNVARGLCGMHWNRLKRFGSTAAPLSGGRVRWGDPIERLWKLIDKDGPLPPEHPELGPCWIWTGLKGSAKRGAYGQVFWEGKQQPAARVVYRLCVGSIPPRYQVDHLCRVHLCVSPAHLEAVTQAENIRRGRSLSTVHALRTSCPKGHPYDEANTYRDAKGGRRCRACSRDRMRLIYMPPELIAATAARSALFGNQCWICRTVATARDHVKPISKGGPNLLANVRPICGPCNSAKHDLWFGVEHLEDLRLEVLRRRGKAAA